MDQYKITAEEFAKVSISRLATHPNHRNGMGEGGMRDTDLKKRFDAQGDLFRQKFNALIAIIGTLGEGSLADEIPTGIKEGHTVRALLEDIVSESGDFASYLSVGELSLLEALKVLYENISKNTRHAEEIDGRVREHEANVDNPHGVTAEQVGLGNVDNTSDADKPVSAAGQMALDALETSIETAVDYLKAEIQAEAEAREAAVLARVPRQSTDGEAVYLTDSGDGTSRGAVALREDAVGGTVPKRDGAGNLSVSTATASLHAVNKAVLDAAVAHLRELLVAKSGDQVIDGDLSLSGNLYVAGSTYATDVESLNVKDAVIVANADGVPLAGLSGYVIRVSATEAYGILYDAADQCVKIGLGSFDGQVFSYGAGEAQVLATRDEIAHGNVPLWDNERKTFSDSGKKMSDKLDISQASSSVYATDADGAGQMLGFSSEAVPGALLIRDKDGRAKVADPVTDGDIANRAFVLAYGGGTVKDEEGVSYPYSISIKNGYPCMTLQVVEETEE